MSALATYNSGSPAFTRVPVSATMRAMGPLTWVMACVVWSLSQSTVPVVRTSDDHVACRTGAILRWGNWSAGTVKYVPCGALPPPVGDGVTAGAAAAALAAAEVCAAAGGEPLWHADPVSATMTAKIALLIAIPAFRPRG